MGYLKESIFSITVALGFYHASTYVIDTYFECKKKSPINAEYSTIEKISKDIKPIKNGIEKIVDDAKALKNFTKKEIVPYYNIIIEKYKEEDKGDKNESNSNS